MEQISAQDLRSVLDCVEALQSLCELQDLPAHIVNLLSPLIGSEASFCSSFTTSCNTLAVTTPELYSLRLSSDYFQENPLIGRYFQTRDCKAYKISDFLTEQEVFRRETLHEAFLHLCGLADQLAMVIPEPSNPGILSGSLPTRYFSPSSTLSMGTETLGNLALGFHRTNRSFTERERGILNLLQPHIAHAYHNSQIYTKLQQQLSQFSQALDDLGSIILSLSGRIQFISPRALQLLNQYFPNSPLARDQFPEPLQSWVKEQIYLRHEKPLSQVLGQQWQTELDGNCLTARLLNSASTEGFVLALEETHRRLSIESFCLIGLTKRESEVLFWVTKGKHNAEIAKMLVLSEKTIKKHLENIFQKLAVKSRGAAVTTALDILGCSLT